MPLSGQLGVGGPDHPLQPGRPHAGEAGGVSWRSQSLPFGELVGQFDDPAVDGADAADDLGMATRPISTTTLPPHDWPATTGRSRLLLGDQTGQILGDRGEVVAVVGLVGPPVTPLVDGDA